MGDNKALGFGVTTASTLMDQEPIEDDNTMMDYAWNEDNISIDFMTGMKNDQKWWKCFFFPW